MSHNLTCTEITYDPTSVFIAHNWNGDATSPKFVWNGSVATAKGSWEYGDWPYHDSLYVRAEFSPLGDTLRRIQMTNYRYGRDPNYRQWEHRIDAISVPLSLMTWTQNVRNIGFQLSGAKVQPHISSFHDYYLERSMQGDCVYERTATSADWNSTTVTPRFEFNISVYR